MKTKILIHSIDLKVSVNLDVGGVAGAADHSVPVRRALEAARLALSACHNCLATDRPDLPVTPETSWTINNQREIDLINSALADLQPVSTDTGLG